MLRKSDQELQWIIANNNIWAPLWALGNFCKPGFQYSLKCSSLDAIIFIIPTWKLISPSAILRQLLGGGSASLVTQCCCILGSHLRWKHWIPAATADRVRGEEKLCQKFRRQSRGLWRELLLQLQRVLFFSRYKVLPLTFGETLQLCDDVAVKECQAPSSVLVSAM